MKGYCGEEIKSKEWKQGISVTCEKSEDKIITYPNIGLRFAIGKMCECCRFNPYHSSASKVSAFPEEGL